MTRRTFIREFGAAGLLAAGGCRWAGMCGGSRLSLNPSTIREFHLPFHEQVRVAVAAGYDGIEPWLKDLHAAKADGTLAEAVARARDGRLAFVNGIAFGPWSNPDAAVRAAGLEETKRDMALLAEIGCPLIAASMFGVQKPGSPILTTEQIAERYAAVLDLGRAMGVRPLLEYWGHSVNLHSPEQARAVLRMLNRSDAAILPDVYHTYRGGGDIATLGTFTPSELPVLHMNDYPGDKPRTSLTDADRIWPGDGAADWPRVFAALRTAGAHPWLSLELFNASYERETAAVTAATGIGKMREICRRNKA